ncbi:unnamed protein product, partial [Choristocarpus tenellus]
MDTRHARARPRAVGQVRQNTPMVKRLGQLCKGTDISCTVEDGSPFTVDWNIWMDLVFYAGALADIRSALYQDRGLLLDGTCAEVQAASHLPNSSTSNGVAAAAAEA